MRSSLVDLLKLSKRQTARGCPRSVAAVRDRVMVATAMLVLGLCVAAEAAPSSPRTPPLLEPLPTEVLLYAQNLTREVLFPRYCNSSSERIHWDVGHAQIWGFCAALQTQLWVVGGKQEASLMVGAQGCLLRLAAQANVTKTADFFTSFPMMLAFATLQRSDSPAKLTASEVAEVRAYVYKAFKTAVPGSNNQHYQRGAGLVLAAQTFPSAPLAKEWLAYGKAVLKLVVGAGDITEDAPNYNKIDLTYLWLLADLLGDTKALSSSPSFRAMFERFAAQIGPAGGIPSYGDSGAARKDAAPANYTGRSPYENNWGGFLAGFMRASVEYPDGGSFAAAAAALFASRTLQPYGEAYGDVSAIFRLLYAVPWGGGAPAPDPTALGRLQYSRVLTRRDVHGPDTPGKVVLRAGAGNASGFLLSDLYGSQIPVPPHAHENQHGQVNWYEWGGYPLVASLGYDNRGPADSNLLLVRPASSSFPHAVPKFRAATWEHASIPTVRMRPRASETKVLVTSLTLRVEWDGKPIDFSAARIVLAGRHGTMDLHLFSGCDDARWHTGAGVRVNATTAPGQGGDLPVPACMWSLPQGKGGDAGALFISTSLNLTIDTELYPEMLCDWRLSRNDDVTRTFIMRFDVRTANARDPSVIDFHASELNLCPSLDEQTLRVVTRAAVPAAHHGYASAPRGSGGGAQATLNDSLAFLSYSSWFRYDTQLNRTMVLSGPEGVLLVHDSLDVGAATAAAAPSGGPIWHLSPTIPPVVTAPAPAEPGWRNIEERNGLGQVLSQGADVNLCVTITLGTDTGAAADLQVGVQALDVWSKKQQQTAFGRTRLTQPGRYSFVSLLVPVRAADLPPKHGATAESGGAGKGQRSFVTSLSQHSAASGGKDTVAASVEWRAALCVSGSEYCGTRLDITLGTQGGAHWGIERTQL